MQEKKPQSNRPKVFRVILPMCYPVTSPVPVQSCPTASTHNPIPSHIPQYPTNPPHESPKTPLSTLSIQKTTVTKTPENKRPQTKRQKPHYQETTKQKTP
jgi:hypothetical protein